MVKDAGGYAGTNAITVQRVGTDIINGTDTSMSLADTPGGASIRFIADGYGGWFTIG